MRRFCTPFLSDGFRPAQSCEGIVWFSGIFQPPTDFGTARTATSSSGVVLFLPVYSPARGTIFPPPSFKDSPDPERLKQIPSTGHFTPCARFFFAGQTQPQFVTQISQYCIFLLFPLNSVTKIFQGGRWGKYFSTGTGAAHFIQRKSQDANPFFPNEPRGITLPRVSPLPSTLINSFERKHFPLVASRDSGLK